MHTTEPKLHEKTEYGLACLAQLCYTTHINNESLDVVIKNLPAGQLRDVALFFQQNERNWLRKVMRSLREFSLASGSGVYDLMKEDLEGAPVWALFDITANLRKAYDLEGIAEVVEELRDLRDVVPILTNLRALIRNEKARQEVGEKEAAA